MKKPMFIIQTVLSVLMIILCIITLFYRKLFPYLELVVGCDLFLLAYNNQRISKKTNLTIMYVVFGVLVFLVGILSLCGVM